MEEEAEKLSSQVSSYLEAGQWHEAVVEATRLANLDATTKDRESLAKLAFTLAQVSDNLRLGLPLNREVVRHLEEIASTWPRLAEVQSFRSLIRAAKVAAEENQMLQRAESDATGPTSGLHITSGKRNNNLSLLSRIVRPKGWSGIAATVASIVAVLLVCNLIATCYLKEQPASLVGPRGNLGPNFILPYWNWLIDSHVPVDTIMLGDSAPHCDLLPGPIADRLGGTTVDLSNIAHSSLLMDAWMLQYYVDKFGPPRNVILLRRCVSYEQQHNLEYMSAVPLKWGYWDRLGVAPAWKFGEEARLFVTRYCVLYSESDILRARLSHPLKLFAQPRSKYWNPETDRPYSRGVPATTASELDQITRETSPSLYSKFSPSSDSTNALTSMTGLAKRLGFQFYIAIGPEWDKLYQDPDHQAKVSEMQQWLSQFLDPQYVHLLPTVQTFRAEQMQNPDHLRPGSEMVYTETILADIVAIQNGLSTSQAKPIQLTSAVLDKSNYNSGEQPTVTLSLTTSASLGTSAMIKGAASCLVRLAGTTDVKWIARSSAVDYTMQNSGNAEVRLVLDIGGLTESGVYDLVLFLRQDVGGLSFETRVELANTVEVR